MASKITVNSLAGQTCICSLHRPLRASEVKKEIEKLSGIPCEVQRLFHATTELRADDDVSEDCSEITLVQRPPEQAHWLQKVLEAPAELRNAPESMQADAEVVLAAVTQQGRMLQYASADLQDDDKVVLAAIQHEGSALEFAGPDHRSKRNTVLQAVKKNGLALQYATGGLSSDPDIVSAAIHANGSALQFAGDAFKSDAATVLAAVQQCGCAWQWAQGDARDDRRIIFAAVARDVSVVSMLPPNVQTDLEVMLTSLKVPEDLIRRVHSQQQGWDYWLALDEAISSVEGEKATLDRMANKARLVHPWARHTLQRQNLRIATHRRAIQRQLVASRAINKLLSRKEHVVNRALKLKLKREQAAMRNQQQASTSSSSSASQPSST